MRFGSASQKGTARNAGFEVCSGRILKTSGSWKMTQAMTQPSQAFVSIIQTTDMNQKLDLT